MSSHSRSAGLVTLVLWLVAFGLAGCSGTSPTGPGPGGPGDLPAPDLRVTVDGSTTFQTILGFGGDFAPWHVQSLSESVQTELLRRVVEEIGIHSFRMNLAYFEGVTSADMWGANDDPDPSSLEWSRFDFCGGPSERCNDDWARLIPVLREIGAEGLYWGLIQGPRWNGFDGASTFSVDEMVENQLAAYLYFRDEHGLVVDRLAPFSEPSGGGIDWPISAEQARRVVRELGRRLERNGFGEVRMIVPDAVSPGASAEYARAILDDPEARRHVAAIGFHPYRSGPGGEDPSAAWKSSREELRALADEHDLPLRMTEFADIGGLMERANHIFNEFEFAESQTYHAQHVFSTGGHGAGGNVTTEEGGLVYFVPGAGGEVAEWGPTLHTGVAVGHYSRLVPPGAVRVATEGGGHGLRVQAFRADREGHLAVVLINNGAARRVQIELTGGLTRGSAVEGIVSREGEPSDPWTEVGEVLTSGPSLLSLELPARSVTSLRVGR